VSLGAIFDRHQTIDHVEALHLVGDLKVAQSSGHKVHNAKTTNFSLLYRAIEGTELGALPLELPPFCERGLTLITRKRVITQVLLLVHVVVNF
jgi:hypothetical protein